MCKMTATVSMHSTVDKKKEKLLKIKADSSPYLPKYIKNSELKKHQINFIYTIRLFSAKSKKEKVTQLKEFLFKKLHSLKAQMS